VRSSRALLRLPQPRRVAFDLRARDLQQILVAQQREIRLRHALEDGIALVQQLLLGGDDVLGLLARRGRVASEVVEEDVERQRARRVAVGAFAQMLRAARRFAVAERRGSVHGGPPRRVAHERRVRLNGLEREMRVVDREPPDDHRGPVRQREIHQFRERERGRAGTFRRGRRAPRLVEALGRARIADGVASGRGDGTGQRRHYRA